MNKPVKFLIIRFSSIGDIVLTTPAIRCLKLQHPNAEIHFFTKEKFRFLIEDNPYVDNNWYLSNDNGKKIIQLLKNEKFDFVIDLHRNLRTLKIKLALGVKSFSFNKLNIQKALMTIFKINILPNIHIVDRNLAAIASFGIQNDNQGLDYFIPDKDMIDIADLPIGFQKFYVVYAIGGQHSTKKLPINRMIELCDKINAPIVLLGGEEDQASGDAIVQKVSNRMILNGCGKYNFNQSASIIKNAKIVFSHDTGLMHVAAAFKKRIYSIWGNTIPAFGMYPYETSFEIIENNNLDCRPCSKIGYDKCPKKHFKCMNEVSFEFDIPELAVSI